MQALKNFIRWNWSGPDSFSMNRSRAHISVVDITDRLQRKILRTCMTEPIASTVSAWSKAERVFKVIFSRWLCSSMIAQWNRSQTCLRRIQTCRMLIRTWSRSAVTFDKGCRGGGRGRGSASALGEEKENILKPFLFPCSIILAVLYLAASSTRKKIVLELFLLEFWSFWYVAYNQNMVFRPSLFLLNARCSIDLAGGTRGL